MKYFSFKQRLIKYIKFEQMHINFRIVLNQIVIEKINYCNIEGKTKWTIPRANLEY